MKIQVLTGAALDEALDDVARLRMAVFRDWPYLYDGDRFYERQYLQSYQTSDKSIVIGAYDGDWLVGASAGTPLSDHADEFAAAFEGSDVDLSTIFYCGESVLLPRYRGRGIGKTFFDLREEHARELGFARIGFCAVIRPDDHPLYPSAYRPLDGFWESRGYSKQPGVIAQFEWKDIDQVEETTKRLQFWMREL